MPSGFHAIIAAQFLSALADNALLIVAIAWLQQTAQPAWWTPLLKFFFIVSYVALAPIVGALADAVPKAGLMAWANGIKLLGAAALGFGLHPLWAFAIVGFGAASYAPAKYGLITERVGPLQLVRANAWIEVTVVGAVLLGTATGGALISEGFAAAPGMRAFDAWMSGASFGIGGGLSAALACVLALYAAAGIVNLGIRVPRAALVPMPRRPLRLVHEFRAANRILWRDRDGGRLSLAVTCLFWGAGAVLQFAVLRWATDHLQLSLAAAAYLQAAVALGVIAGAGYAGRHISLQQAPRLLLAGVVLGVLVAAGPAITATWAAVALLVLVGIVGGLLLVPMNALLQHRGFRLLSPGRSIAVQGFNENASVLLMLAVYAAAVHGGTPATSTMVVLGLSIAAAMVAIGWRLRRSAGRGRPHRAMAQMPAGRKDNCA